jgi:GntR family histidine utilization transcriptional repressor
MIPSEVALAAEFGCARATVNRALRELAESGILDRRRKAGTRVSPNPVHKATFDIPVIRREIEASGGGYRHAILETTYVLAPSFIQALMSLDIHAETLHIRTLHLSNDQPYLYEDRWINMAATPGIRLADFSGISVNEWLVQNAPLSGGELSFLAKNADEAEAEALDISVGTALFVTERLTRINQSSVTFVRLAYAPGYRMTAKL